jgi:hypothetical protein
MTATLPAGGLVKPAPLPSLGSTGGGRWLHGVWRLYIVIALLFGAYMAINDIPGGEISLQALHHEP